MLFFFMQKTAYEICLGDWSSDVCSSDLYFQKRMAELLELDMVGDVRGSQFMVCVETTADKKQKLAPAAQWDVAWRIFEKCRPKGLMVRPLSHLVILSPPLVITRAQIDQAVEVLKQGIKEVFDDLTREGFRTKA